MLVLFMHFGAFTMPPEGYKPKNICPKERIRLNKIMIKAYRLEIRQAERMIKGLKKENKALAGKKGKKK